MPGIMTQLKSVIPNIPSSPRIHFDGFIGLQIAFHPVNRNIIISPSWISPSGGGRVVNVEGHKHQWVMWLWSDGANHKINSKRPEKFNPLFILTTKALYLNVVFQTKRKDTVIFINKRWHFMKGALIRLYIKDPTGVRTTAPGLLGLE